MPPEPADPAGKATQVGADNFLSKPYSADDLLDLVTS